MIKKIAVFGGTFNPIHNGHIIGIQALYDSNGFDEIWLMPSGIPPFKQNESSSALHRLNMCHELKKCLPFVQISDYEIMKDSVSYTYETLCYLSETYPEHEFFWTLGYDNLFTIESWYEGPQLLSSFPLALLNRGGYSKEDGLKQAQRLDIKYKARLLPIIMPTIELSSTSLRNRVFKHKSLLGYTSQPIIDYILSNKLYLEE